jgi:hypothetical protein
MRVIELLPKRISFSTHTLLFIPGLESPYINKLLHQLKMTIHGRLQLRLKTCKVLSGRTYWRSVQCRKTQFFLTGPSFYF